MKTQKLTLHEQIIDAYEDLILKLTDTLIILITCVNAKKVTNEDENKLFLLTKKAEKICSKISSLKAQAEHESNNRQQSEGSANNLKTAEEILKGEMSENLWTFICSYPVSYKSEEKLVEWIIDAMQEYAAQFKTEQEKVTDAEKEEINKGYKSLDKMFEGLEEKVTDEDIEKWVHSKPGNSGNPLLDAAITVGAIEGAKAMRDGKITHNK